MQPVSETERAEIGERAALYLEIENSGWAYAMWFMSGELWWDARARQFRKVRDCDVDDLALG